MANEKIVTYTEFQNNPELRAKFEGNYESYLNSFSAKLFFTSSAMAVPTFL